MNGLPSVITSSKLVALATHCDQACLNLTNIGEVGTTLGIISRVLQLRSSVIVAAAATVKTALPAVPQLELDNARLTVVLFNGA